MGVRVRRRREEDRESGREERKGVVRGQGKWYLGMGNKEVLLRLRKAEEEVEAVAILLRLS